MFGWADIPAPLDMSHFDRDTELEEKGPEPLRVASDGRASWWDTDEWGEDD